MSVSGAFPLRSFPPDATAQALDWLAPKQKSHFTEAFLSDQPSPFSNHAQLGAALSFPQSVQQSHATHPFALQQQQQSSLMTLLQQMQHPQQHPLFQQQSPQQSQQQQQYISPQQQWQQLQSQPQGRPLDRPVSPASLTSDSSPPRSGERDQQSVSPFSANTISSSEGGSVSPGPILPQKAKPSKKSKQQTSPTTDPQEQIRSRKKDQSKRGLTKCACVPCRKIKAACESTRPCARCVRVGKSELCIDHVPLPRGGYRVPKAKRLAEQNAAQQEAPPPAHTLSHPTTSQPLFEASGLLLDLVPQQYSQQYSEAVASAPNPEESADWSACLPPPSFTPVSELMWLEDEALFSLLDQFDKEAQNPSRKNQQLLVSMAWVLCDVICFSGCFRAPASKDSISDGGPAVHPISQRRSSASSTDSGSSSLVPSSPKKSLFSASSVGLDSSHPFFPLFRSLASPDNVKRERLWSLLNTWKHASEIQQTLQLMARAAPDDTVRDLYEAELVKSAFLPFGVVVCPLNHYLAPGLPPVTNHKLNAMLGYSKEDAEVVCSSCPFYRMSERHSLSNIKRLAYQAIRHGRTSFTLPMTFIHKNNQSLRVVVSLKLKYHNYLPMLCVCYVQLADASSTGQVVELQGPSL